MSTNETIAALFREFAELLELTGANRFRVIAHEKVARAVEGLADEVATLAREPGRLEEVEGIGEGSATRIREFLANGSIADLEALRAKVPPGLPALLRLEGLGPKTVKLLWDEAGVTDVDGLKAAIAAGTLAGIKGLGEKKIAHMAEAIALSERNLGRIRLDVATGLAESLVAFLRGLPGAVRAEYAGSARRGRETIGDVDALVSVDDPRKAAAIAQAVEGWGPVEKVLVSGETKVSVRTVDGVQADVRIVDDACFGAALLYFTGSKEHNVVLRERAQAAGRRLNEYGLFELPVGDDGKPAPQDRGVKPLAARTEEEIYAALGLPFLPPEVREDRGETTHPVPRLVELSDLKAELHAHTTASDGFLSIEELAEAAKARGFHTIAVTDHSRSSVQANGLSRERLLEHIEAVREAARKVKGITVLAGSEVDILADGRLDYDDGTLARLDLVVASPHTALRQSPEDATARLLKAIAHPAVRILGHPTGRIVLGREGLAPDLRALVAAARERDVALEINAHPARLDLRDTHVRAAIDGGALLSINCDTHAREDLANARYGVLTARRGWATADRIVNCWSAGRLHAWLARKKSS
jgi:DNA polymerase (family 10)